MKRMKLYLAMLLGVVLAASQASAVTITQPISVGDGGDITTGLITSATTAIQGALPLFVIIVAIGYGVRIFKKLVGR